MKKNHFLILIALAILSFSSCSEDADNPAPAIENITAVDNVVTVEFSEAVYANNDKTGNLSEVNLNVTITDVTFTYAVAHTAGDKEVIITLDYTTIIPEGTMIIVTTATAIYDNEGGVLDSGTSTNTELAADLGIIGKWYSSGTNVAPLLVTYFLVDSIYAEFNDDFTMDVEQYNIGNTSGVPDLIFHGTFTIEKSTTDNIWTIVVAQELPYVADVSGIFEIKGDPELLWYEVVQTSGTQNIPPTPETGFGSSNGGAFGETNIQKFIRM